MKVFLSYMRMQERMVNVRTSIPVGNIFQVKNYWI